MIFYLLLAGAIPAAVCVILNQYWNIKKLKKENAVLINNRTAQQKLIFELSNSEAKAQQEIKHMKSGWFPANRNSVLAAGNSPLFKTGQGYDLKGDYVHYYTLHGPVFRKNGFIEYSNLLVYLKLQ